MPAPSLKRYAVAPTATTWTQLVPILIAGRALVVSKLVVTPVGGAAQVRVGLGANSGPTAPAFADYIVYDVSLAAVGEVYTESGLIVSPGLGITVYASVANVAFAVYGEEVDN